MPSPLRSALRPAARVCLGTPRGAAPGRRSAPDTTTARHRHSAQDLSVPHATTVPAATNHTDTPARTRTRAGDAAGTRTTTGSPMPTNDAEPPARARTRTREGNTAFHPDLHPVLLPANPLPHRVRRETRTSQAESIENARLRPPRTSHTRLDNPAAPPPRTTARSHRREQPGTTARARPTSVSRVRELARNNDGRCPAQTPVRPSQRSSE